MGVFINKMPREIAREFGPWYELQDLRVSWSPCYQDQIPIIPRE
jgi:hypothetical protein